MRAALVLRPEPGNAATVARLAALGVAVRRCPLFAVEAVEWTLPKSGAYDALLLTSANAVRFAGPALQSFAHLPVLAVGSATAAAARQAGLSVALTGDSDAPTVIAAARGQGWTRPLHLAGQERRDLPEVAVVTVYRSVALPVAAAEIAGWADHVALLHSPRAARRLAMLVEGGATRARIAIAALSPAIAAAAGYGWRTVVAVAAPRDDLLASATLALIDPMRAAADKRA